MDHDFVQVEKGFAIVRFQSAVYGLEAIKGAAHRLTDRCFVHIEQDTAGLVTVRLKSRGGLESMQALASELANHVLDQSLRVRLAEETGAIRNLLIAQAFSKANLSRPDLDGLPGDADPVP